MNYYGIKAIYNFEMTRFFRTLFQSFVSPVIATSLYFVVFGAAIGSRIQEIDDVSYGTFIVPGLIMLTVTPNLFQMALLEFFSQNLSEPFMNYSLHRLIFLKLF